MLTLDSGINVGVRLLIFGLFSSGYVLIKGGTFINFFFIFLSFKYLFFTFFPSAMYKKIKLSVILRGGYAYSRGYVYCFCQMFQGLRLFKGVRLFRSLEYKKTGSHNIKYCSVTYLEFKIMKMFFFISSREFLALLFFAIKIIQSRPS